jgi:RNA polymerase sigma factor (sigma-70 family)
MNAVLAMPFGSLETATRDDAETVLVRRAAAGDTRAFEALYRQNIGRVFGAIVRLTGGNEARADELVQEAFVRAWQRLGSFRFESAFSTWLYRLAVNTALMDLRSRAGAEALEDAMPEQDTFAGADTVIRHATQLELERSIAKLPPRARAVLVLHDVEGWKHEEIANELGMAVGSSKAQLHRARGLLRKHLGA